MRVQSSEQIPRLSTPSMHKCQKLLVYCFFSCGDCHLQIVDQGLMTREDYEEVSRKALSLFEFGQVSFSTLLP